MCWSTRGQGLVDVARLIIQRVLVPSYLSFVTSYDVASYTTMHLGTLFLELTVGII